MRRTSAAALLVLLALAACGGSERSFAEDYNRAVEPLSRFGQGMGAHARDFDRLARLTARTRANLAKLHAPDDAQDEFDTMLATLTRVTADLKSVASATRSKDVVRQRRAARRLLRANSAVQRAEAHLRQAVAN